MIQSALEQSKKTIVLDRLIIKDTDGKCSLINDPHLIKEHVNKHFQNFAIPDSLATSLFGRWIDQYQPKNYVDNNWFNNLMQPPLLKSYLL